MASSEAIRRKVAHLTMINRRIFFETINEPGHVFTYSEAFLLDEVRLLAREKKVEIEYQTPESKLYKKHGCYTCKVIGSLDEKEEETFLFDPNELVLY